MGDRRVTVTDGHDGTFGWGEHHRGVRRLMQERDVGASRVQMIVRCLALLVGSGRYSQWTGPIYSGGGIVLNRLARIAGSLVVCSSVALNATAQSPGSAQSS